MSKKSPKQLFYKLFYRYTAIVICIVLALVVYFISNTKSRILETNLNYRDMMNERAFTYMEECLDIVNFINADLAQSTTGMEDLLQYFKADDEAYQRYRLDKYMESTASSYDGFDDFMEKAMRTYANITHIELISYGSGRITDCYPENKMYIKRGAEERLIDIEDGNLAAEGEFAFTKEIRNPENLQNVGCMIIYFDTLNFEKIHNYYNKAELMVYNREKTMIYSSIDGIDLDAFQAIEKTGRADSYLNAYTKKAELREYIIYTYLDKKEGGRIPASSFLTIIVLGMAVIVIGEWCIQYYFKRLTKRLNYIIDGMHQVMTGDLSVRLQTDQHGDELDVISDHFNEMCQQLERYIQKSYLAEIEQKNAELEVLQNQINPHFLYNTLEAIRMKAICNGDREVGKMLYSMAVIFRSQLKEEDFITVISEIHYCKKYLELFEYRYQGKFTSEVECPEELMNYPIMKFILQPVIENYFVHGIRGEQEGNQIQIRVEKESDALLIHVIDNGRGMEAEAIAQKNLELQENSISDRKSIGVTNVNRRVKAVYGKEYGVLLKRSESGGMHVIVKVGLGEGEKDEKDHVD